MYMCIHLFSSFFLSPYIPFPYHSFFFSLSLVSLWIFLNIHFSLSASYVCTFLYFSFCLHFLLHVFLHFSFPLPCLSVLALVWYSLSSLKSWAVRSNKPHVWQQKLSNYTATQITYCCSRCLALQIKNCKHQARYDHREFSCNSFAKQFCSRCSCLFIVDRWLFLSDGKLKCLLWLA